MTTRARTTRRIAAVSALTLTLPLLAVTGPAAAAAPTWRADLRVDANRDGTIDSSPRGGTDQRKENSADARDGALFLPNLDDDTSRCPRTGPLTSAKTDPLLDSCHDAADAKVNGGQDSKDLAHLRVLGQARLPKGATGRVAIGTGKAKARLFVHRKGWWQAVTSKTRLSHAELTKGVTLGIEGKDVAGRGWDGRANVNLWITAAGRTTSDTVAMRVAPVVTHHHAQTSEQVLVSKLDGPDDKAFRRRLGEVVTANGIPRGLRVLDEGDQWTQDFLEPMHTSVPRGKGVQSMRLLLRSDQDRWSSRSAYTMRGKDVGVLWMGKPQQRYDGTLSSMGNLETIPPYTHRGKTYPAGRVVLGERGAEKPSTRVTKMLRAQGVQDPLMLDTSFLYVGHVDEFIQFLPAKTPRGWQVAVADPKAALDLLRTAKAKGQGARTVIQGQPAGASTTINQALGSSSKSLVPHNEHAARVIAKNIAKVKAATGVTDAEILRIPTLYDADRDGEGLGRGLGEPTSADGTTAAGRSTADSRLEAGNGTGAGAPKDGTAAARAVAERQVSAFVPGAINSLVLNQGEVLAATQFGPKVAGTDIFADAVTTAYGQGGIKVRWIDDFITYHLGQGEVHCGTNSLRAVRPWWR